jgi:hypothetical protein
VPRLLAKEPSEGKIKSMDRCGSGFASAKKNMPTEIIGQLQSNLFNRHNQFRVAHSENGKFLLEPLFCKMITCGPMQILVYLLPIDLFGTNADFFQREK